MLAIVLGLGSGLAWGVADFWGGLASRRSRVLAVVLFSQATGLVLVAITVGLRGAPWPGGREFLLGAAAGLVGLVGLVAFYRALAVGTMGLVAPVAALGVVVPVAAGLAGGERPGSIAAAGAAVAIVGATLAARAPGPASRRGLGLAVVAAAGFGGFFALLAPAAAADPLWAVLAARSASVPAVLVVCVALGTARGVARPDLALVLGAGVLDAVANVLFAFATRAGLLSVVAVLGSLYPVATVLLARFLLAERLGRGQAAGVAVALAGVCLIAAGA